MASLTKTRKTNRQRFYAAGTALAVAGLLVSGGFKIAADYKAAEAILEQTDLSVSNVVLDRNDRLLRAFLSADEKWRLPVELDAIDPIYFKLLIAYEDRRFREHSGVDLRALVRAGVQLASRGRVVSGGSTLTMQVARLLSEEGTRSLAAKYHQVLKAIALEDALSKDEILALYALRAPFGGNLEGIRAASLIWFGKEPSRLTLAEAALLVALPQSPEGRRPDRSPKAARNARDRVLDVAAATGVASLDEIAAAKRERLPVSWRKMPQHAPHKSRQVVAANPARSVHHLTLDLELQKSLESLASKRVGKLGRKVSMAIVVADHTSSEILAAVGSPGLHDRARQGHVDMTEAVRSPGSTLKPYIYGLAFEDRIALPESLIQDRPVDFDGYRPTNFDQGYQGAITVRHALQQSLNTPAVQLLDTVGPARLMARMKRAGLSPDLPGQDAAGLAIGLGGVGVSLMDLVRLYAGLAELGRPVDLHFSRDGESETTKSSVNRQQSRPFLSEAAAWQVVDILSGLPQPQAAKAQAVAYKTGTSYGYRDAWSVGFDGQHVVGVWVGRPDGSPVSGQTGAESASPILFEVFQRIGSARVALPQRPDGVADLVTAELPIPLQRARIDARASPNQHDQTFKIMFPPDNAVLELAGTSSRSAADQLVIKLQGGKLPFVILENGKPVSGMGKAYSRQFHFVPTGPGVTSLAVIDRVGNAATVRLDIRSIGG
ncbi:penicillin-binding protein 1C [Roseibium sediminis]|uniref:penicillin-binding protein 1C n=1 Tax=Roseibium sediminis TaxID=1775174 RepID=UPI00123CA9C2|nr:penicillin-binding protein 1C [Roseibium sediminis]